MEVGAAVLKDPARLRHVVQRAYNRTNYTLVNNVEVSPRTMEGTMDMRP